MVLGRDVHTRGFFDNAGSGKADIGRAHGELVGRAAEKAGHWSGEGVGVVEHHVQPAGFDIAAHCHRATRHLYDAVGSFLNTNASRAVHIGKERIPLLGCALGGFYKLVALGSADRTTAEGAHKHGHHHLGIVYAGLKGHAAALGPGLFLRCADAVVEIGEVQRIARFNFAVELKNRTGIKDVFNVPFRLHRKVVAAMAAHARKLRKKVRSPQVKAAVRSAVGAGDRTVCLVTRGDIVPLETARIVGPGRKGHEFLGLAVLFAGQLVGEFVPGSQQAALEHFPFVVHFFHKGADAHLVLTIEIVLEAHPGFGNPVPGCAGQLGDEGPAVTGGLTRKAQELLLAFFTQAVLGLG